jgi:signal transduction histidine kinase
VRRASLYGRIAVVFAAALIGFGAFFAWLSYDTAMRNQGEVLQRLSQKLAASIAANGGLFDARGLKQSSVDELFHMLMIVNPNIEVYLLDTEGRVIGFSPTDDPVVRKRVDLAPIRRFLSGASLPVRGDNPRAAGRQDIFSAAPVERNGAVAGYVYVVLLNGMYRRLIEQMQHRYFVHNAGWIGASVLALSLLAGLAAFALITRRHTRLTHDVEGFERRHFDDELMASAPVAGANDEIDRLAGAFERLKQRLASQMSELRRQDALRRELVANVSHDLRTPLTSMQSYLETLQRMGAALSPAQQRQYLDVAVRQSRQVARLAQQLFELAQLELEEAPPQAERFSMPELMQDIAQKFSLQAERAGVRLVVDVDREAPFVCGDIGLIERVITNFVDNALRHSQRGGEVRLQALRSDGGGIAVGVADTGSGIATEHLASLFRRDSPLRRRDPHRSGDGQDVQRRIGGLGLLIAHRILALHGIAIDVRSSPGEGSCFRFVMRPDEGGGDGALADINLEPRGGAALT